MNLVVALMPHPGKEAALALAEELIARLLRDGVKVWLEAEAAAVLGREDLVRSDEELAERASPSFSGATEHFSKRRAWLHHTVCPSSASTWATSGS